MRAFFLFRARPEIFNSNPNSEVVYGGVVTSLSNGGEWIHTPPFDFGIQFSKVTKEVSDDFWNSHRNKSSFTGSLAKNDFVNAKLDPGRDFLNPSGKEGVLRKATKKYLEKVGHWTKLECLALDDAAARTSNPEFRVIEARPPYVHLRTIRDFELSESTLDEEGLNLGGLRKKMSPSNAAKRHCGFKNWFGKLASSDWIKPEYKLVQTKYDEVSKKPRWESFAARKRSSASNDEETLLVVTTRMGMSDSRGHFSEGSLAERPLESEFLVAGNFFFPTKTYTLTSPAFLPVPVRQAAPSRFERATLFGIESVSLSRI